MWLQKIEMEVVMRGLMLLLIVVLGACSDPPVHKGKVTDRWGKALAGVTVAYTGSPKQLVTASDGTFTIPIQKKEIKIRVGKPGYIKSTAKLQTRDEGSPEKIEFSLYPNPETSGFYAVTSSAYSPVVSMPVKTLGTEIRAFNGLVDKGGVRLSGAKPIEFVFSSEASRTELLRLGLQLHKLKFVQTDTLPGVLGETEVKLNLWVADETVPFDLEALETDDDYKLQTRETLEPGVYAFHTQNLLTDLDMEGFDKLPAEMRVAFPFEVR
ncbi:MAG: hypothetical protein CL930_00110 [Deltaproteobacteria bacterium]|nr:hypothetical protein [Deltaproteobacteria bacterium]